MKKHIVKVFIFVMSFVLVISSFASCENSIKRDEAKNTVNDFLELLAKDDYEGITALMHPDKSATSESVGLMFQRIEAEEMLDFSLGITEIKYTGVESSVYSSEAHGGKFEYSGHAKAGTVKFEFEIELRRNDGGYGIFDIDIDS